MSSSTRSSVVINRLPRVVELMAMLESYEYRHSATSGMATAMICGRYQAIIQKAAERSPEASKVIEHMLELVLKAEGVIE